MSDNVQEGTDPIVNDHLDCRKNLRVLEPAFSAKAIRSIGRNERTLNDMNRAHNAENIRDTMPVYIIDLPEVEISDAMICVRDKASSY